MEMRALIEADIEISLSRQCELLGLSRSSYYYQPVAEDEENLLLMKLIDRQYTETPFYGVRQMTAWLRREGHEVNPKRVRRLYQSMALSAICPGPHTSKPGQGSDHQVFPYLLRGLTITHPGQVLGVDITYIPMRRKFLYLVAFIDWYSRYVLSWELSNSLDSAFCLSALSRVWSQVKVEIINSDQGAQFTSKAFVQAVLVQPGLRFSMDGKGRAIDNVFTERLWRSLKYEEVYLREYQNGTEAWLRIHDYFHFYNHERPHSSLQGRSPHEVFMLDKKT